METIDSMKRVIAILAVAVIAMVLWNPILTKQTFPAKTAGKKNLTNNSSAEGTAQKRAQRTMLPDGSGTNSVLDEESVENQKLWRESIDAYLLKTKRSPESLLNAFWETHDTSLLTEAVEKHPENPMVQWAKLNTLTSEERGPWLEKLQLSAPDNALPNYLSALDNLKAGNVDKALAEMDVASHKKYSAFEQERAQSREEQLLLYGSSPLEAREEGMGGIRIQNLTEMKQLAIQLGKLQKKYTTVGDAKSAQQLAMLGIEAGRNMCQPNTVLINTLVGFEMESIALRNLSEDSTYEFLEKTPGQRLQEIEDQKKEVDDLVQVFSSAYPDLSESEKLIYLNRSKFYGGLEALRWLKRTYGEPK